MEDRVKVWRDPETGYLEGSLQDGPGTFRETPLDRMMATIE
jgi:hypothetical protein